MAPPISSSPPPSQGLNDNINTTSTSTAAQEAKKPKEKATQWKLRTGYRFNYTPDQNSHGLQIVFGPSWKVGQKEKLKIGIVLETNLTFLRSPRPPETLSQNDILGANYLGVRESIFDGQTYTDIADGVRFRTDIFGAQFLPEFQLSYRPSKKIPFAFGFRASGIINYSKRKTDVTLNLLPIDPSMHENNEVCIEGDIYCEEEPIPEPQAGASSKILHETKAGWAFNWRAGPVINFPWTKWLETGAELLFVGNNDANGGVDLLFRASTQISAPIHKNFELFARPRYILSKGMGESVQHGFDLVTGFTVKW